MFSLLPEEDKTTTTSPFFPKPSNCRENISSYPKSFAMQVIAALSALRESDGNDLRLFLNLPISSTAKWELSAALPPLPHQKIVF